MGYPDSGGRAQFAMPAALKKRPPMEAEPGEGKVHEMKESPEEEIREGSEAEEGAYRKPTNRKRTVRGAKRTKAPMDSDCGCGAPKGKKCSCDSGCGNYAQKMDSALTAQEYIAACDLGIQDRSRPYIRTRLTVMDSLTPTTVQVRTDKKCGASAIPDNKQCRVGGGGETASKKSSTLNRISGALQQGVGAAQVSYGIQQLRKGRFALGASQIVGGSGNLVGGQARGQGNLERSQRVANSAYYASRSIQHAGNVVGAVRGQGPANVRGYRSSIGVGSGISALGSAKAAVEAARGKQNKAMRTALGSELLGTGVSVGGLAYSNSPQVRRKVGEAVFRAGGVAGRARPRGAGAATAEWFGRQNARRGSVRTTATRVRGGALVRRGDSVWAAGFEPRTDKKCGASGIADNKQCRNGTGAPSTQPMSRGRRIAGRVMGTASALASGMNAAGAVYNARKGNYGAAAASGIGAVGQFKASRHYYAGRIGKGVKTELATYAAGMGARGLVNYSRMNRR